MPSRVSRSIGVLVAFLIAVLASVPVEAGFATAVNYPAGTGPRSVAVGDFNGDGKQDLAVANSGSNNVSILLGNGNGAFQAAVNYGTGSTPRSVAVGDFDGDGKQDLAVANSGSNTVSILLGNGNGTFKAAVGYAAGSGPASVAVGDFDGDGKQDLAVANANSGNVSILGGNGNGTFKPPVNIVVGSGPRSLVVGDFNGDGRQDLAVANSGSNNVSILRGNGDGTFQTTLNNAVGTGPESVAVGDFNGDGKQDLAVANLGSASVSVLLGAGDGTFSAAVNHGAGTSPASVAVGDFNGDGRPDLAVANNGSANVSLLSGNGNGTFKAAVNYGAGTTPRSVAAGDFDADGKQDLAVANQGSNDVSVLINDASLTACTFRPAVNYPAGTGPSSVAGGDFDRDGKQDLAVANSTSGNVSILLNNGNGTFKPAVNYPAGTGPSSIAVGDFDRDGKLDLGVANAGSNNVSILLGDVNGTFKPAVNFAAGAGPSSVAVGDFDRDGKQDLAIANRGANNVSILLGNGNGTFQAAVNYNASTGPASVTVGDFNGDGKQDLAVANGTNANVSILLGNGNGTFQTQMIISAGTSPSSLVVGDFNREGKRDLAVANHGSSNVSIRLGNGNGGFGAAVNYGAGTGPASLAVGDFNGDGKQDLAVANDGSANVSILPGNGDGTFQTRVNHGAGTAPASVAVGDFNGNGRPDLAVANRGSNNVSILTCPPDISIDDVAVPEGNLGTPTAVFTLTLYPASTQTVTVNFATANGTATAGSDYTAVSGTVTFAPGSTTQTINVPVIGDLFDENDETFSVNLTSPVNATVADGQGVGTILDDDGPPAISINDVSVLEGNSGTTNAVFTVSLSVASGKTVTVNHATASGTATLGSDYTAVSGTLTFPPGSTAQTVSVPVIGDLVDEDNETFFVNLTGPVNATIADGQGTGTIIDDDGPPAVSIADCAAVEVDSGTSPCAFHVSLSAPSSRTITVAFSTADDTAVAGADYLAASGTLTFAPGVSTQDASVSIVGDTVSDPNKTYFVNLSSPTNATIGRGQAIGTITDNDNTLFFTLDPCRIVNTGAPPGPSGGPALGANTTRIFPAAGICEIPATAKAIAVIVTTTQQTDRGDLRVYHADGALPSASTINFAANHARANNAIVPLGTAGQISVTCDMAPGSSGTVRLIVDVYGYFE
jgi:hypothetical protein